jgi:hypothetical protein
MCSQEENEFYTSADNTGKPRFGLHISRTRLTWPEAGKGVHKTCTHHQPVSLLSGGVQTTTASSMWWRQLRERTDYTRRESQQDCCERRVDGTGRNGPYRAWSPASTASTAGTAGTHSCRCSNTGQTCLTDRPPAIMLPKLWVPFVNSLT